VTDEQIQELRKALAAGRIKDDDPSLRYEFRRGWNDGVEFAQNQVDKIFGKEGA
jgi:hypothetical protein